ncbi:MAG: hypothetical protein D6761_00470 [Candidatus Dadabacteria bacterium]|nr:MAG: hypothetical protein D6761_00470 [Candidatus Dadabacteria bacterium]
MKRSWIAAALLIAAPASALDVLPSLALRQSVLGLRQQLPTMRDWDGLAELRARPGLTLRGAQAAGSLEIETRLFSGTGNPLWPQPQAQRFTGLKWTAVDQGDVVIAGWIDRADVTLHAGPVDIQIGRQPVGLGTAHFLGVLDIIAPFAPGDLDATFRPGVDALRLRGMAGARLEWEVAAVGADPVSTSGSWARGRILLDQGDLELVGGWLRRRGFGGLGFDGEAGLASIWAEALVIDATGAPRRGGKVAAAAIIGAGGRPLSELWIEGAMLGQSHGVGRDDLLAAVGSGWVQEGWWFLVGHAHAMATIDWEATALSHLSATGVLSLTDGSMFMQPRWTFSVSDEADLSAYGWITAGKGARLVPPAIPEPRSEFGSLPRGVGLYARWFF